MGLLDQLFSRFSGYGEILPGVLRGNEMSLCMKTNVCILWMMLMKMHEKVFILFFIFFSGIAKLLVLSQVSINYKGIEMKRSRSHWKPSRIFIHNQRVIQIGRLQTF
jgi:hypothetical protein